MTAHEECTKNKNDNHKILRDSKKLHRKNKIKNEKQPNLLYR